MVHGKHTQVVEDLCLWQGQSEVFVRRHTIKHLWNEATIWREILAIRGMLDLKEGKRIHLK